MVKLHEMKIVKKQYLDVLIHNKITNFEAFWWNFSYSTNNEIGKSVLLNRDLTIVTTYKKQP